MGKSGVLESHVLHWDGTGLPGAPACGLRFHVLQLVPRAEDSFALESSLWPHCSPGLAQLARGHFVVLGVNTARVAASLSLSHPASYQCFRDPSLQHVPWHWRGPWGCGRVTASLPPPPTHPTSSLPPGFLRHKADCALPQPASPVGPCNLHSEVHSPSAQHMRLFWCGAAQPPARRSPEPQEEDSPALSPSCLCCVLSSAEAPPPFVPGSSPLSFKASPGIPSSMQPAQTAHRVL